MKTDLEAAAIAAFAAGHRWHQYVAMHRDAIRAAEQQQKGGVVEKLLALVTAGNLDGHEPPDVGEAWGTGQGTLFDVSEPHRG